METAQAMENVTKEIVFALIILEEQTAERKPARTNAQETVIV